MMWRTRDAGSLLTHKLGHGTPANCPSHNKDGRTNCKRSRPLPFQGYHTTNLEINSTDPSTTFIANSVIQNVYWQSSILLSRASRRSSYISLVRWYLPFYRMMSCIPF